MFQLAVVIVAAHVIVLLYVSVSLVGLLSHICLIQQLVFFTAVSLTNYLVMVMDCGVVQRVICGILKMDGFSSAQVNIAVLNEYISDSKYYP